MSRTLQIADGCQVQTNQHNSSHLKKRQPRAQSTLQQSFKNKCTNLVYKFNSLQVPSLWRKNIPTQLVHIFETQIYLQGKHYNSEKEVKQALKEVIWFTYRSHFKVSQDLSSDTGWGCLLRVGQMLLAAAIRRFFSVKLQTHIGPNSETNSNIIYAFLDDPGPQEKYSILSMMKVAAKEFKLEPGQWFNIAQIGYLLEKLQNKNPMKGANELKIVTFNQSIIFLEEVYNSARVSLCKCPKKKIICRKCHAKETSDKEPSQEYNMQKRRSSLEPRQPKFTTKSSRPQNVLSNDQQNNNMEELLDFQRHLLIIVVVRLAINKIPKASYEGLLELISLDSSLGVIGGIPKKALYLTGRIDNQLIYLDPHYVQESVTRRNFLQTLNTFHCEQFRTLDSSQLDPSMGFAFYVKNLKDLQKLTTSITKLKENKKNDFLSVMWGNTEGRNSSQLNQSYQYSEISDDEFSV